MDAKELIAYISSAPKKTPVRVFLRQTAGSRPLRFPGCQVFGAGDRIIFGDWNDIAPVLQGAQKAGIVDEAVVEHSCRNSAVPLLDVKDLQARIEPGAVIREQVEIGSHAVIMMGAILNIGAKVGPETMIDMGAVLGGRAQVGARCHVGAGAVLAGVIEPPGARPVIVEDDVCIGANAVLLEGIHVGKGAVIAAGSVVTEDVPAGCVAAGLPARVVKEKDQGTASKTDIIEALRKL